MNDIAERIAFVLQQHPTLNAFGFGAFDQRNLSAQEAERKVAEGRRELCDRPDEVAFVVRWLSDVQKTKRITRRYGSYALKHIAEKSSPNGYIRNGAFITGAIIAGFKVERNDPNAFFNMSLKSLEQKKGQKNVGE